MNIKTTVTIKTPLGDTDPLFLSNFVKQVTVLDQGLYSTTAL